MGMKRCPHCDETTRQNKVGKTKAGSQRYQCMYCHRKYTPNRKPQGYPTSLRKQATEMYVDGGNLRRIARHLKVHHRTISLGWRIMQKLCLLLRCLKKLSMPKWTSYSLSLEIKKQNLHFDSCRSQNTLYFGLDSCMGANPRSDSTDDWWCTEGKIVLQRWVWKPFICL